MFITLLHPDQVRLLMPNTGNNIVRAVNPEALGAQVIVVSLPALTSWMGVVIAGSAPVRVREKGRRRMVVPGPLADEMAFARSVAFWIVIWTGGGKGGAGGCGGREGERVGAMGPGCGNPAVDPRDGEGGYCGAVVTGVG